MRSSQTCWNCTNRPSPVAVAPSIKKMSVKPLTKSKACVTAARRWSPISSSDIPVMNDR